MNPSKVIKNSKSLFRSDSETGVATDTGLISIESNDASPEEQAARAELNQALKKIFSDPGFLLGVAQGWDGLTQAQQNVVVRDWAGDSNRQGAAALGIKVENYKMQLFRARESLRLACQQALLFGCARQVQEIIPRLKRQF